MIPERILPDSEFSQILENAFGLSQLSDLAAFAAEQAINRIRKMRGFSELPLAPFPVLDVFIVYPELFPLIQPSIGLDEYGCLKDCGLGVWKISVNVDRPADEQRFTIAHELGHFLFVQYMEIVCSKIICKYPKEKVWFITTGEVEKFCDTFAYSLLLPSEIMGKWVLQFEKDISPVDIEEGARFFGVPVKEFTARVLFALQSHLRKLKSSGEAPSSGV